MIFNPWRVVLASKLGLDSAKALKLLAESFLSFRFKLFSKGDWKHSSSRAKIVSSNERSNSNGNNARPLDLLFSRIDPRRFSPLWNHYQRGSLLEWTLLLRILSSTRSIELKLWTSSILCAFAAFEAQCREVSSSVGMSIFCNWASTLVLWSHQDSWWLLSFLLSNLSTSKVKSNILLDLFRS